MANLSANTVWEVMIGGDDTNGGGFVTGSGGTDYSQQTTPILSRTDGTPGASNTLVTAGTFTAAMVGNILHVISGTDATPGWYEILSVDDANTVTVNADIGVGGSDIVFKVGGAFATYGMIGKVIADHGVSGMTAFIKYSATSYEITSASDNVSGGVISLNSADMTVLISGYDTTRTICNEDANRPLIVINNVTPGELFVASNTSDTKTNLLSCVRYDFDGYSISGSSAIEMPTTAWAEGVTYRVDVDVDGENKNGFHYGRHHKSKAIDAAGYGFSVAHSAESCVAEGCTSGFNGTVNNSIATGCTTGFYGGSNYTNCTAYDCTTAYLADSNDGTIWVDCVATNNSGVGFDGVDGSTMSIMINCATGDNTGGRSSNVEIDLNPITLPGSGTYFENAATGDFRPKSGDGDLLMGAGLQVPSSANNTARDVGAVQHAYGAGGGGGSCHVIGG